MVLQITPGERAALCLLANGNGTYEIAGRLGIREYDVEPYLATLFVRMGAASRTEAIAAATRRGIADP